MNLYSRHSIETSYECREYFVSRIRCGVVKVYYCDIPIYIRTPTDIVEHEAIELYHRKYEEAMEEGMLTDDNIFELLVHLGKWSEQKQNELDKIVPEHIEYWKTELYNAKFKSDTQKTLRKHLQAAKTELEKLHTVRYSFNYVTCTGYAAFAKNQFLIEHSSYYKDGRPVNWRRVDLNYITNAYFSAILSPDLIRILARTNPWRDEWSACKKNGRIFDNSKLGVEQKSLIIWSTLYDNIAESPEAPSEDIISDDDMLDGWLILQRRKNGGEKIDDKINKIKGNEVFLVAETADDAKKIDLLNSSQSRGLKKQRFSELKQKGVVKEQNFSDSKLQQALDANQLFKQKVGGK